MKALFKRDETRCQESGFAFCDANFVYQSIQRRWNLGFAKKKEH